MTRDEIQSEIGRATQLISQLLQVRPSDEDLLEARTALQKIEDMISKKWPLPPSDRAQINVGLYAVRVLEGGPYGELPHALMVLDNHLKNG